MLSRLEIEDIMIFVAESMIDGILSSYQETKSILSKTNSLHLIDTNKILI